MPDLVHERRQGKTEAIIDVHSPMIDSTDGNPAANAGWLAEDNFIGDRSDGLSILSLDLLLGRFRQLGWLGIGGQTTVEFHIHASSTAPRQLPKGTSFVL